MFLITIHTDGDVSTKRPCDFQEEILQQHGRRDSFRGTRYGIASSIASSFRCFARGVSDVGQAGYR